MKLPPESESSHLKVAQSCFEAIKALAPNFGNHTLIAFGMLAGQGMESTLKCHLLQKGRSLREVHRLGHDLVAAWNAAATAGLPIEGAPPEWLTVLNWGHAHPFAFRYPPDGYGVGAPQPETFVPWWGLVLQELCRRTGYGPSVHSVPHKKAASRRPPRARYDSRAATDDAADE